MTKREAQKKMNALANGRGFVVGKQRFTQGKNCAWKSFYNYSVAIRDCDGTYRLSGFSNKSLDDAIENLKAKLEEKK